MQILQYSPGQIVTIFLDSFNSDGYRADGYDLPIVTRIINPDLTLESGFPVEMTKIDTGLYYFKFVLPKGAVAVGSYLVDVTYWDPVTIVQRETIYQIVVSAPFGNYSASVSV